MESEKPDMRRRAVLGMLAATATLSSMRVYANEMIAPRSSNRGWPVWSVQRGDKTIYLMGETPPRAADWHDPHIEQLFGNCSALWTETNQVYRAPQKVLLERFAIDPARPLSSWLSLQDHTRLRAAVSYCKLQLSDLEPYRPWCAASVLQDAYYGASGAKGASADRVLSINAVQRHIPQYSEFATKDDVFAWFGSMTPVQEVQFLRYTLDEILASPQANANIYDDWAVGKPARAAAQVARFSQAYPELVTMLTKQRNARWMPRFKAMLTGSDKPPLVVVGLYHLVGTDGLLSLAQRNGMTVLNA